VAYIFLFWAGRDYDLLEDNSPTQASFNLDTEIFAGHNMILQHLNNKTIEKVMEMLNCPRKLA
jgi:hypothetical protein